MQGNDIGKAQQTVIAIVFGRTPMISEKKGTPMISRRSQRDSSRGSNQSHVYQHLIRLRVSHDPIDKRNEMRDKDWSSGSSEVNGFTFI